MNTANPVPQSEPPSLESEQRAHEPSMEEILASIRRIIADDDALPLMRRPSLVTREAQSGPAERSADLPRHPLGPPPSPASVVHLVPAAGESDAAAVHPDLLGSGREERVAADEHDVRPSFPDELPDHQRASARSAPVSEARIPPAPVAHDHEPRETSPLVSPSTDASVSSSFQSLATSMFLRDSDLIARTAREMLRPMLKQWLDDNLPVMVERLVRAEIERVARGGR
jgi:uncharacterized protein